MRVQGFYRAIWQYLVKLKMQKSLLAGHLEKLAWVPKNFYSSPIFVIVRKKGNNINVPSGEWLSKHKHPGIFYNKENELELHMSTLSLTDKMLSDSQCKYIYIYIYILYC